MNYVGLQPQSPGVKLQGLHTAILILTKLPGFRLRGWRFLEAFQHEIHDSSESAANLPGDAVIGQGQGVRSFRGRVLLIWHYFTGLSSK